MPFKTPTGGVLLSRLHRGLLMALIAAVMLAVIRHLASRPEQRIGSSFFNPGGPGDSGVAAVTERGEALDALTAGRFDIVGWDIRGSAGSSPVLCFANAGERASFWQGLPVPTTRTEQRRYLAKTVALAQRCGARNGELLAHITTADTARDSTTCVGWWGTGSSAISGSPTAPSSARPTPTCSRAGSGPWSLTALSIRSPPPLAPRRCWPAAWPTPTGCSGSSSGCARRRAQTGARSPATARSRSVSVSYLRGSATTRSRSRRAS